MDLVQSQISDQMIGQLTEQLGGGVNKEQTAVATTGILGTLMSAMAKNAGTPDGAAALNNALERDHDGGILEDVMGMITGQTGGANDRTMNGAGILSHVLGQRQSGAVDMISKMSGLNQNSTSQLMVMLAPMVMGMLGKTKRQNNLDAGGVADLLNGFSKQQKAQSPAMGMIESFLDQDGDGSIADDVAGMGMKLLGGLFKRRR